MSLVVAMMLAVMMGMAGVAQGCATIQVFRAGSLPERPLPAGADVAAEEANRALERAELSIRLDARRTLLPLAIANLLLSALLFGAAWRVLGLRPGARSLATQALAANALFAIVEYSLTRDVRGKVAMAFADHFPRAGLKGAALSDAEVWSALDATAWLLFRAKLVLVLLGYAVGYSALQSPAAVAMVPPAEDRDDEET